MLGEVIRTLVGVGATVAVIVGLIGFSTGVDSHDALVRATLATGLGVAVLAIALGQDRQHQQPRIATVRPTHPDRPVPHG